MHNLQIYNRLTNYIALIEANEYLDNANNWETTIANIAARTEKPIQLVRSDFLILEIITNFTYISFDFLDEQYENLWNSYGLDKKKHIFSSGDLDNTPFYLTDFSASFSIPFSSAEQESIRALYASSTNNAPTQILMKRDPRSFDYPNDFFFNIDIIQTAIAGNNSISFKYSDSQRRYLHFEVYPVKLLYDSIDNKYAFASFIDGEIFIFRLDRLLGKVSIHSKKTTRTSAISQEEVAQINKITPSSWGFQYRGVPSHVRVKFYNEANVWERVKFDLSYRTNAILRIKDNYLYYEDNVLGLQAFKSWIMAFGSSAIVIEPTELRDDILRILRTRLNI